jgi:predicted nucleic acid-binding protein
MVLVDSSAWIEYFKGNKIALPINDLIDINNLCVNELILAELIPSVNHKKENKLKELLMTLTRIPLKINWNNIINMQTKNLKNGINKVGLVDLLIAENVIANGLELFAIDKHFTLMSELHGIREYNPK